VAGFASVAEGAIAFRPFASAENIAVDVMPEIRSLYSVETAVNLLDSKT